MKRPRGAAAGGVLAVNVGSTSVKISLVHPDGRATVLGEELAAVLASGLRPRAAVHRVVHGGDRAGAAVVDDAVLSELRQLTSLAPLHQAAALDAVERARAALPGVPQVACFDTAFHRTIPPAASTYALPQPWRSTVRVYGFHGLSHAWASRQVAALAPGARRVVVAHLGGGASMCAVLDGRSVDTTMGFTPLDGLVMATRCGHLDPGALLWLHDQVHDDLADLLETRSGLLGLTGSTDLREILRLSGEGDAGAALAIEVYQHALRWHLGAMVAALQGIDALVLTGGVGELSWPVAMALCRALGWLGVDVVDTQSEGAWVADGVRDLTAPGARVRTFAVHAREDLQMVAEASALLA